MAGKDRPVPPADALRIHLQPTPPECSLGVHKNTHQFVAESPPGILRREAVCLVEAGVLVVAVARSRSVNLHENANEFGPLPTPNARCLRSYTHEGSQRGQLLRKPMELTVGDLPSYN